MPGQTMQCLALIIFAPEFRLRMLLVVIAYLSLLSQCLALAVGLILLLHFPVSILIIVGGDNFALDSVPAHVNTRPLSVVEPIP